MSYIDRELGYNKMLDIIDNKIKDGGTKHLKKLREIVEEVK